MSDLISREAAIDACHNWDDGKDAYAYGFIVEERLQKLPSAQQWIPVSDRLPEAATDVLVCNDDQKQAVAIMQTQDFYGHTMKEWYIKYCPYDWDVWDEDADGKIVAWMPLPEPYKEGQDERT